MTEPIIHREQPMITIHPATIEDAPAILALNAAFDDVRATVEQIAEHIDKYTQFETPFVAEQDGRVVGLACLRLLPSLCDALPYAELTELVVDPAHRRRGIGQALVRQIEEKARKAGADSLHINTAEHNRDAQAFYQALGYRSFTITLQRSLRVKD